MKFRGKNLENYAVTSSSSPQSQLKVSIVNANIKQTSVEGISSFSFTFCPIHEKRKKSIFDRLLTETRNEFRDSVLKYSEIVEGSWSVYVATQHDHCQVSCSMQTLSSPQLVSSAFSRVLCSRVAKTSYATTERGKTL